MRYKKPKDNPIAQTVSFMITEKCNLRCTYCYEENKKHITMDLDVAKDAVDYILNKPVKHDKGIFEFIGGEPLVEFDLMYDIIKYIDEKLIDLDHPWKNNRIYSITTNGTLFTDKIKEILKRNRNKLSVGISLDGSKIAHDLNRKTVEGNGSYDKIMEDFDWWRKTFPWNNIKATVNHDTLPYLFESVKHLIDLGLDRIEINNVFENVWTEDDPEIFKNQLIKLADYLIDTGLYEDIYVGYFTHLYNSDGEDLKYRNWCGSGTSMISIGINGELYPCHRFQTLSQRDNLAIGDIYNGIDQNKLKPFEYVNLQTIQGEYKKKCNECEYKKMCSWCTAYNYDVSGSIFRREGMFCDMVEAQYKANKYFFEKIEEVENANQ
jgi:radical SAM peptide maturase (CXXX-repeat target family)